jgi:hypothetical protein
MGILLSQRPGKSRYSSVPWLCPSVISWMEEEEFAALFRPLLQKGSDEREKAMDAVPYALTIFGARKNNRLGSKRALCPLSNQSSSCGQIGWGLEYLGLPNSR